MLHIFFSNDDPEQVIGRATDKLAWIRSNLWKKVAAELYGEDPYRFLRAYSPGEFMNRSCFGRTLWYEWLRNLQNASSKYGCS